MNVVTARFHTISKDLKLKPDDNCQAGREQALSAELSGRKGTGTVS